MKTLTPVSTNPVSVFAVDSKGSPGLAGYVRRIREERGFSLLAVARNSQGQISDAYVSRIENGFILNVTPKKLRALARGLQVSEDEIFQVARGIASKDVPDAVETRLILLFRELPGDRQQDLLRIAETLHREHAQKPAEVKSIGKRKRRVA